MRSKMRLFAIFIFLSAFGACNSVIAQEDEELDFCATASSVEVCERLSELEVKEIQADFLVPASPAFDVLGVSPDTVIYPGSARQLGFSVLNGMDPQGNIQSGLAIDAAPYQFSGVTLQEYRDNYWQRLLTNTQLSIATTKGASDDDESVRSAIGFRINLFDVGDPRISSVLDKVARDLHELTEGAQENLSHLTKRELSLKKRKGELEGAKESLSSPSDGTNQRVVDATLASIRNELIGIEEELSRIVEKREEYEAVEEAAINPDWNSSLQSYEKGNWNASSASVGFAGIFFTDDGSLGNFDQDGYAIYSSLAYGFDQFSRDARNAPGWLTKNAQILLHARYTENEVEAVGDDEAFRRQDTEVLGAQVRLQGPRVWADQGGDLVFSAEASRISKDFVDGGQERITRYAGAVEIKPFRDSGLTIKALIGSDSKGEDNNSFVATTLSWSLR